MARVTVYTKPFCPYCSRALGLLQQKGVEINEIEAASDMALRQEMIQKSGRATYPQIFIGDRHIGVRPQPPGRGPGRSAQWILREVVGHRLVVRGQALRE